MYILFCFIVKPADIIMVCIRLYSFKSRRRAKLRSALKACRGRAGVSGRAVPAPVCVRRVGGRGMECGIHGSDGGARIFQFFFIPGTEAHRLVLSGFCIKMRRLQSPCNQYPSKYRAAALPLLAPSRRCDSKMGRGWGYMDFHCIIHIFRLWIKYHRKIRRFRRFTQIYCMGYVIYPVLRTQFGISFKKPR